MPSRSTQHDIASRRKWKRASGFTLVEMSIVLMIIGLLLGGILKGQELINSAKTRHLSQEFLAVQIAFYAYQDRYKAVAGDNPKASAADGRATAATTPPNKAGNGHIDGEWDSAIASDESFLFWQHVRLAGLLAGPPGTEEADYLPQTLFGSKMGISSTAPISAPTAMPGSFNICASDIPGRFARQMDMQNDDGNTQTGAVRVADPTSPSVALPASAVADGEKYLLCAVF